MLVIIILLIVLNDIFTSSSIADECAQSITNHSCFTFTNEITFFSNSAIFDETKIHCLMITDQVMHEQTNMNNLDSNIIHFEYLNITQDELDLELNNMTWNNNTTKDAFIHENNQEMESNPFFYLFYLLVSILAIITSLGLFCCIKH